MAMDLAAMEVFARVVEARSFSGAARRLEMSTSVVSKCVTRLEESLGVRLLNRTTRSISLTEIGREFYARCSHIVAAAEEAQTLTAGMQAEPCGVLKVNVPVSFGILHIVPALGELMIAYPRIAIDMTLSDREVHLAEEGYDVAVSIASEPRGSLVARKLAPIRRRLCAAPGYLKRRRAPATLDDLAHHDCIVHSLPGGERAWHFEREAGVVSVEVNGSLRFDNENAIRKAALAGLGVALLPTYIVGDDLREGRLRLVLPELEGPRMALFATYLPNRYLAAKVRVFVDYLVAMFGPEPQWDAVPRSSAAVRVASPAASPAAGALR